MANYQNPHKQSPLESGYFTQSSSATVIMVVGRQGWGKTGDTVFSFPKGYFIAASGAVDKVAASLVGFTPNGRICDYYGAWECTEIIKQAADAGYEAVIVDDFSLIAENTMQQLRAKESKTGFSFWNMLTEAFLEFRLAGRAAGIHVIINAHPQEATTSSDGTVLPGGAAFPIKKLVREMPKLFDTVLHVRPNPKTMGQQSDEWPMVYSNVPLDQGWITKDRNDIAWEATPMNLREILHARNYKISRAPGLEWQEDLVEWGAQALISGASGHDISQQVWAHMQQIHKVDPSLFEKHFYWTVRDISARARIRKHLAERLVRRAQASLTL